MSREESNRNILLPSEVDEILKECGRAPLQLHLPPETLKQKKSAERSSEINHSNNFQYEDTDDDETVSSEFAMDLNDTILIQRCYSTKTIGKNKKPDHSTALIERSESNVKLPPVIGKQQDGSFLHESSCSNDNLSQVADDNNNETNYSCDRTEKKKKQKSRKASTSSYGKLNAKVKASRGKSADSNHSKKMMNSLLQPLAGSLSHNSNNRGKSWVY